MADITHKRRQGELLRGLFTALVEAPNGLQAKLALAQLVDLVPPTDFEQQFYPSGGRRYEKIVRFSTITVARAGWMEKDSGIWSVTALGQTAYAELLDPEAFMKAAVQRYRQWKAEQSGGEDVGAGHEAGDDDEEEIIDTSSTLEEAEEAAALQIRTHLQQLDPFVFQELVAGLLEAMDYHVAFLSQPGVKDAGLDVLALADPLGVTGPRIKVQVKRTAEGNKVSVEGLRAFLSLLDPQDVGVFVALGGFTPDAVREARAKETKRITLVSFADLLRLWVRYYDKLSDESRRRLPLRPIYYLEPEAV